MLDTAVKTSASISTLESGKARKLIADTTFLSDVLQGLALERKSLSPKYFYDTKGSEYFDEICKLDEYYPYRSELTLLPQVAASLAERFVKPVRIVEFGAGALRKIQSLLSVIPTKTFIPIDISGPFLDACCERLRKQFPSVYVDPITADFCDAVAIPRLTNVSTLGFFPGSTIGNFSPEQAVQFLRNARETLGANSHLLIGVDTKKSPSILHQAYNDSQQITEKFNLNVLHRINAELGADFDVDAFEHYAFYNTQKGCIEMHLVSKVNQFVRVVDTEFYFRKGESIHTESSYKYNTEEFVALALQAGWRTQTSWLSDQSLFSMHLLES